MRATLLGLAARLAATSTASADPLDNPASDAIARGLDGPWVPSPVEVGQLQQIFPQAVCDYGEPDVGLPPGW